MSQTSKDKKTKRPQAHAPASEIAAVSPPAPDKRAADNAATISAGTEQKAAGASESGAAATAGLARVDGWFDRQLVDLYGEVADEAVPNEILALINQLKDPH